MSAIGDIKGLKEVRRIVLDCMKNVHPIYHIKILMIKRELSKDERLKTENWDRFLPKYKKNLQAANSPAPFGKASGGAFDSAMATHAAQAAFGHTKGEESKGIPFLNMGASDKKRGDNEKDKRPSKSKRTKNEKEYTPFPPPQLPRKEDLLLESGEYFLKPKNRKHDKKHKSSKSESSAKKAAEKSLKKLQKFTPPKEKPYLPV